MTTFADVLPVEQVQSHQYRVNLEEQWCIGTVPNGGYTTSTFMTVASRHMQLTHAKRKQPHVINLHLEFLRRTAQGEAIFNVKDVKLGSRITNLHLTLAQMDDSNKLVDEVEGYITMSDMASETGLSLETGYKLYPEPLAVDLLALAQGKDANYIIRGPDAFASFRRAANQIRMHLIRPQQRPPHFPKALIDQWITFRPQGKEGRLTNDAIGFVVDIFPQIVEQYVNQDVEEACLGDGLTPEEAKAYIKKNGSRTYWYPTLSLNLDVKKLLPQEGVEWLFVRIQAKSIKDGRFDLLIHVLDEGGDLVALSTHSSLAVDASRNTTRTKKKENKL
ncbi:hypothetical protein LTS08_007479 [Lithohypha guttulata]|nr:hypothetical protein LTR51_002611 [Lithohypha guttulata]KAK5096606.1 hypothetical protein LTS08_007479 [Lithohypha guttulata]